MSDLALVLAWTAVPVAAFGAGLALRHRGVDPHRIRDALHVGAGIWVLGWPAWDGPWPPSALAWTVLVAIACVPTLASRSPAAARVVDAVTSSDERWTGLVLYGLAFAALTTLAFVAPATAGPAGAALLALAWGDGLGGAVGQTFGRRGYRLPWTKRRTWLGTVVVGVGAAAGALAWSAWTPALAYPSVPLLAGVAAVAAVAEAAAPRGGDNLTVPAAVFAWLAMVA